jgi:hypothetical protein
MDSMMIKGVAKERIDIERKTVAQALVQIRRFLKSAQQIRGLLTAI